MLRSPSRRGYTTSYSLKAFDGRTVPEVLNVVLMDMFESTKAPMPTPHASKRKVVIITGTTKAGSESDSPPRHEGLYSEASGGS